MVLAALLAALLLTECVGKAGDDTFTAAELVSKRMVSTKVSTPKPIRWYASKRYEARYARDR